MLIALEPKVLQQLLQNIPYNSKYCVFNLNSNYQSSDIITLNLMPPPGVIDPQSQEFDTWFITTLITDDRYFVNLMNMIIPLYHGKDVFVLIYNEPEVFSPINETIFKLIQQRYGYNYQLLNSIYDFDPYADALFTTPGIQTFDEDFKRYQELVMVFDPGRYVNEKINDEHL